MLTTRKPLNRACLFPAEVTHYVGPIPIRTVLASGPHLYTVAAISPACIDGFHVAGNHNHLPSEFGFCRRGIGRVFRLELACGGDVVWLSSLHFVLVVSSVLLVCTFKRNLKIKGY